VIDQHTFIASVGQLKRQQLKDMPEGFDPESRLNIIASEIRHLEDAQRLLNGAINGLGANRLITASIRDEVREEEVVRFFLDAAACAPKHFWTLKNVREVLRLGLVVMEEMEKEAELERVVKWQAGKGIDRYGRP